jgi:hypothetical protein
MYANDHNWCANKSLKETTHSGYLFRSQIEYVPSTSQIYYVVLANFVVKAQVSDTY